VITRVDHVQVAAPAGGEPAARAFYGELLGLDELLKPEPLRARGGVWFAVGDQQLHVGIEEPFAPARRAHPAFAVPRAKDLRGLAERLERAGHSVTWDGPRIYVADPFGNRLELLGPHAGVTVRALRDDERAWAAATLRESWGSDIVIGGGRELRPAELPALVAEADGERAGLATYQVTDRDCELVSLDALTIGAGIGSALVEGVADVASRGLHAPARDHHQRQPPGAAPLPAPWLRPRRRPSGRRRPRPPPQARDLGHRPRRHPDPRRARAPARALSPRGSARPAGGR
jgi:catechol 2,3-dioxygenase-like lactoylglutathione lyase family enzyme